VCSVFDFFLASQRRIDQVKNRQRVGKRQPAQEKQKQHQPEEDEEGAESEEDAEGEEDDDRDSEGVCLQILSAPLLAIQQPHALSTTAEPLL